MTRGDKATGAEASSLAISAIPQQLRLQARTLALQSLAPKNEIALLSTEAEKQRNLKSYKPPKQFVRWQPDFVKPNCQFVSRQAIGGRCFPVSTRLVSVNLATLAGHKICFSQVSRSLRTVVPIGCFFGGFPPPPVTFRQRGSAFVERHCSPSAGPSQRVLPVFIRALRKPFGLPSKPFGFS